MVPKPIWIGINPTDTLKYYRDHGYFDTLFWCNKIDFTTNGIVGGLFHGVRSNHTIDTQIKASPYQWFHACLNCHLCRYISFC